MVNTAQVLEVEEVQGRRGLRIAGGADDRLRRQMHQIGDTLQVDGKRATLQDATRERGPEEVKCPSQTKHEGAGNTSTGEDRVIGEKKRRGERPGCRATQKIAPSPKPRPAHFFPDILWSGLCFGLRKCPQELCGFA